MLVLTLPKKDVKVAEMRSHWEERREEAGKGEKHRRKDLHAVTGLVLRPLRIKK